MGAGEIYRLTVKLKPDLSSTEAAVAQPGQILAPNERKETERGIAALKSGNPKESEKRLEKAYKLAPRNADVSYLLGILYAQEKDTVQARTYLTRAVSTDSRHVRALTMLGQLRLEQGDAAGAIS